MSFGFSQYTTVRPHPDERFLNGKGSIQSGDFIGSTEKHDWSDRSVFWDFMETTWGANINKKGYFVKHAFSTVRLLQNPFPRVNFACICHVSDLRTNSMDLLTNASFLPDQKPLGFRNPGGSPSVSLPVWRFQPGEGKKKSPLADPPVLGQAAKQRSSRFSCSA